MSKEITGKIVNAIIDDLSGRSGLGNEWDGIDEDIQDEIREEWSDIVGKILSE